MILVMDNSGQISGDVRPLVRMNVQVIVEHDGKREQGSAGGGARQGLDFFISEERALGYAREAVRQALVNLLDNSAEAISGEGSIVVRAQIEESDVVQAQAAEEVARELSPAVDYSLRGIVAAAVILDPASLPAGLNDSKKLSAARRTALAETFAILLVAQVIGAATVLELMTEEHTGSLFI